MPQYYVIVSTKDPDFCIQSGYDIEAPDYHKAEKEAREKFCSQFGFKYNNTKAFIPDRVQIDYRYKLSQNTQKL